VETIPEPELEIPEAQIHKSFEGPGLYVTVKLKIVDHLERALMLKERILQDGQVRRNETAVMDLKAVLVGPLYEWVEPKLDYPQFAAYGNRFKELRKMLDPYAIEGRELEKMGPWEAFRALRLVRQFIEIDGVSRYEQEKDNIDKTNMKARNASGIIYGLARENDNLGEQNPP
jgi:hypothetical protein